MSAAKCTQVPDSQVHCPLLVHPTKIGVRAMNGFTLLMTLASLGVDFSYGMTADKQREYAIQIEPEVLPLLTAAQPQHIDSDVPLEAGQIQRLCIRIGMTPITHTAASEQAFRQLLVSSARTASLDRALASGDSQTTILWPASGSPQQAYGVTHGYQPDKDNQQQYYVQIDPTVLRTLAPGDEIHATIDPAVGRVVRFIVSAGNQQLPLIATKPLAGAGTQPAPAAGGKDRHRFQFTDTGGGSSRGGDYAPVASNDSRGTGTGWG